MQYKQATTYDLKSFIFIGIPWYEQNFCGETKY